MILLRLLICVLIGAASNNSIASLNCTEINAKASSASAMIWISFPGKYCLTESLHARLDFADHRAQPRIIMITAGDVVIDLQGHTLGRGIFFKNPGGNGIELFDNVKNITVKNGTLRNFSVGVRRAVEDGGNGKRQIHPIYDRSRNRYHFSHDNLTFENITFKDNSINMYVEEKNHGVGRSLYQK